MKYGKLTADHFKKFIGKLATKLNRQRNDFGQFLAEVPKEQFATLAGKLILVSSLSVAGKKLLTGISNRSEH